MVWLRKEVVLERYAKEDNPIRLWSVFVFLIGGVGAVFLAVGIAQRMMNGNGAGMIFVVLGVLLILAAAAIFGCSVREYLSVRRRIMEDDFRSVKVTCTGRDLTRKVLGEGDGERTCLELRFEDQSGNVYRWRRSGPPPELLAVKKGSVHYLVGIRKNKSWRLFQLYSVNDWRLDW